MNKLKFEYHYNVYRHYIGRGNEENDLHFINQAKIDHTLVVHDILSALMVDAVTISRDLLNREAEYYMIYGVARRLNMIWASYRGVLNTIQVDRREPLDLGQLGRASRDLNTIYINILGALDNLAWCLLHEVASEKSKALHETRIGLFSNEFLADSNLATLKELMLPHMSWRRDLKSRRDPAAHRIPLSIPPAILLADEVVRYQDLEEQIGQAFHALQFERVDELRRQQAHIGTFQACFGHHPDHGLMPIYPTVPEDLGILVQVLKAVLAFLNERAGSHSKSPR